MQSLTSVKNRRILKFDTIMLSWQIFLQMNGWGSQSSIFVLYVKLLPLANDHTNHVVLLTADFGIRLTCKLYTQHSRSLCQTISIIISQIHYHKFPRITHIWWIDALSSKAKVFHIRAYKRVGQTLWRFKPRQNSWASNAWQSLLLFPERRGRIINLYS